MSAALGFGALAVAQVMHGGAFQIGEIGGRTDGEQLLIALHTLGYALILIGVVGGLRPSAAASAPVVVALEEPAALAPAATALLLSLVTLAAAGRSGNKALRRLALAAFLLSISEALTAFAPDHRFGSGGFDRAAYAAHGIKVLAYFALASWLWSGVRSSIRTRFVAAFGALLLIVVLTLATSLTGVISSNVEDEELVRVQNQIDIALADVDRSTVELKDLAERFASGSDLQERVASRSGLGALAQGSVSGDENDIFEIDLIIITGPRGEQLAFAGEGPGAKGPRSRSSPLDGADIVSILGSPVVTEVTQEGLPVAASVVRVGDTLPILAAARVEGQVAGRTVGVVILGRYLDNNTVETIGGGAKATLIVGRNKIVGSTLPRSAEARDILPRTAREELAAGLPVTLRQTLGDESYFAAARQLVSSEGQPLGAYLVLSSPGDIVATTRESVTRTLFIVALGVGAVALVLAWLSGRRITRPIQVLTAAARDVREGDLTARAEVSGEDEVGQLGETFNEMTASLVRMTDDLREAAREERSLRARIETIIESMADGLVAVDASGDVLAFNREAEKLTGIKADSAVHKSVRKLLDIRNAQGERIDVPIYDVGPGSMDGVFVWRLVGDPVPIAITSAVLQGVDGESIGAVAVLRDMSREREIERMKSEFLANISHELRTPLTPIKGYAEILARKDVPPDKAKKFIGGILESTQRLERIVGLLVDFSAMEAGRLSPRNVPIDVGAIIKELCEQSSERSPQHNVIAEVEKDLPQVMGDERLLRRSLEEVLDNAVKFSPDGGTIRVEAEAQSIDNGDGAKRHVGISVIDEGIGIPPEDLPRIFSDFQQLDGSETRTYGGLGLGLAFVHRIVEAHSGTIHVESEVDEGTRLAISLPAAQSDIA